MLHPTIQELTKEEFNRYELTLATAKCARILTDEYVKQRDEVERAMALNKDGDRSLVGKVDDDLKDEKAIKNAITRLWDGRYEMYRGEPEEIVYVSKIRPIPEEPEENFSDVFEDVEADDVNGAEEAENAEEVEDADKGENTEDVEDAE